MSDTNTDRLGELPDVVLHHILSFLDMKEVLQTSLLSKRYLYLWISLPNLNFDEIMWIEKGNQRVRWLEFENFVDQVLLQRDDINIQTLHLSYSLSKTYKIGKWISSAVKRSVQEMHLHNLHMIPFSLAGQVKRLTLKDCTYKKKELFKISAPRLQYLKLENSGIPACKIEICAPNLRTLLLTGYTYEAYSMHCLSLETAEIHIHITEFYTSELHSSRQELVISCLEDILAGVRSVEGLTLSAHCLKFFPELSDGLKQLPMSFPNLRHLKLTDWRRNSYNYTIEKLLGSFPNLELLVLERTTATRNLPEEQEGWGAKLSFHCFHHLKAIEIRLQKEGGWGAQLSVPCFHHLKAIEIVRFDGRAHELQFLEFLVKKAMVLEHITIKVTKTLSGDAVKMLTDFCNKMQVMQKSSSSVTIKHILRTDGSSGEARTLSDG